MTIGTYIFFFVLGLVFGNFLNVVIGRLPNHESLISPSSHCPKCGHPVRFYDNIPVISYLILKGQCRDCKNRISIQYPLVELLTGFIFIGLYHVYSLSWEFLGFSILALFLITIAVIDLHSKLILNKLTIPAFLFGILFITVFQFETLLNHVLAALAAGGFLFLLAWIGKLCFKKDSMGMGDVKLMMVTGIFMGFPHVFLGLLIGIYIAAIIILAGLLLKKIKLGDQIPFGPFIALGTLVYLLWGDTLIQWYLARV